MKQIIVVVTALVALVVTVVGCNNGGGDCQYPDRTFVRPAPTNSLELCKVGSTTSPDGGACNACNAVCGEAVTGCSEIVSDAGERQVECRAGGQATPCG